MSIYHNPTVCPSSSELHTSELLVSFSSGQAIRNPSIHLLRPPVYRTSLRLQLAPVRPSLRDSRVHLLPCPVLSLAISSNRPATSGLPAFYLPIRNQILLRHSSSWRLVLDPRSLSSPPRWTFRPYPTPASQKTNLLSHDIQTLILAPPPPGNDQYLSYRTAFGVQPDLRRPHILDPRIFCWHSILLFPDHGQSRLIPDLFHTAASLNSLTLSHALFAEPS
ncbi:hypothetical protein R3P38DRAFT_3262749 [Favolaschia claudopus]|uniref:Uncharacterized protein n=1 Tax=Favolaschia claudopus TaxID=2862362 RepID=A0AAW0CH51_9AGAR